MELTYGKYTAPTYPDYTALIEYLDTIIYLLTYDPTPTLYSHQPSPFSRTARKQYDTDVQRINSKQITLMRQLAFYEPLRVT